MKRRILSIFCALVLCLTLLPATEVTANDEEWTDGGWYVAKGTVTINGRVTVTATSTSSVGFGIGGGSNRDSSGSAGIFSTGDSGNAVIFASGGGSLGAIQDNTNTTGWQGVILQGNDGQVYGNVPQQNYLFWGGDPHDLSTLQAAVTGLVGERIPLQG